MLPVPHQDGIFKLNYSDSSFITCSSYGKQTPSSISLLLGDEIASNFSFTTKTVAMDENHGLTEAQQLTATFTNIVENPSCADIQARNSDQYRCISVNYGLKEETAQTNYFIIEITCEYIQ